MMNYSGDPQVAAEATVVGGLYAAPARAIIVWPTGGTTSSHSLDRSRCSRWRQGG